MRYIEIKAPAKINIGLSVLSKREDGFHNLSTLFYPIKDLFDMLTFELSSEFSFNCSDPSLPVGEENLVVKAKNLLEQVSGKKLNAKIDLIKNIPSQAGLGGGSSDAAAALISLNELFRLNLKSDHLLDLALKLGSDVPFFLRSLPAIGTSRGEILERVDLEITEPILIINPRINVPTKEAFKNIIPKNYQPDYRSLIQNEKLNYGLMKDTVTNDFEKHVFEIHPEIETIKKDLYSLGAEFALMSGSGSTVYGIFKDLKDAESAKKSFPTNYLCFLSNPHH